MKETLTPYGIMQRCIMIKWERPSGRILKDGAKK